MHCNGFTAIQRAHNIISKYIIWYVGRQVVVVDVVVVVFFVVVDVIVVVIVGVVVSLVVFCVPIFR